MIPRFHALRPRPLDRSRSPECSWKAICSVLQGNQDVPRHAIQSLSVNHSYPCQRLLQSPILPLLTWRVTRLASSALRCTCFSLPWFKISISVPRVLQWRISNLKGTVWPLVPRLNATWLSMLTHTRKADVIWSRLSHASTLFKSPEYLGKLRDAAIAR